MVRTKSIPSGYNSITPYFTVVDADRMIEFLKSAFDASIVFENRYPNNRIQHARLRIGDSVIMLNESSDEFPNNVSQMHLFVEDCVSIFEAAIKSGAEPIMEPNVRPHGDRMAGIKDPCGNIWWIATYQGSTQQ